MSLMMVNDGLGTQICDRALGQDERPPLRSVLLLCSSVRRSQATVGLHRDAHQ